MDGKKKYVLGKRLVQKNKNTAENNYIKTVEPLKGLGGLKISRESPKMWDVKNPEGGSDKGRKVHEVLSYIKERKDLGGAIKRAIREGLISNLEKEEIEVLVKRLIEHPKMERYFYPGLTVKNEEDILLRNAKVLRPDRLVFDGEGVTVIDYKTGRVLDQHTEQVLSYKSTLEEMGYQVKCCVLAYVNDEGVTVKQI